RSRSVPVQGSGWISRSPPVCDIRASTGVKNRTVVCHADAVIAPPLMVRFPARSAEATRAASGDVAREAAARQPEDCRCHDGQDGQLRQNLEDAVAFQEDAAHDLEKVAQRVGQRDDLEYLR